LSFNANIFFEFTAVKKGKGERKRGKGERAYELLTHKASNWERERERNYQGIKLRYYERER
jgi:hypothetical protein